MEKAASEMIASAAFSVRKFAIFERETYLLESALSDR
jgi:hypothetical protein